MGCGIRRAAAGFRSAIARNQLNRSVQDTRRRVLFDLFGAWPRRRPLGKQASQASQPRHRIGYNRRVRLLVLLLLLGSPGFAAPHWERLETRGASPCIAGSFRGPACFPSKRARDRGPDRQVISALSDVTRKREWVFSPSEARLVREPSVLERVEYNRSSAPGLSMTEPSFSGVGPPDRAARRLWIGLESVEDPAARGARGGSGPHRKREFIVEALGAPDQGLRGTSRRPAGAVPKWLVNIFKNGGRWRRWRA